MEQSGEEDAEFAQILARLHEAELDPELDRCGGDGPVGGNHSPRREE
jgi:hypothetical protein